MDELGAVLEAEGGELARQAELVETTLAPLKAEREKARILAQADAYR